MTDRDLITKYPSPLPSSWDNSKESSTLSLRGSQGDSALVTHNGKWFNNILFINFPPISLTLSHSPTPVSGITPLNPCFRGCFWGMQTIRTVRRWSNKRKHSEDSWDNRRRNRVKDGYYNCEGLLSLLECWWQGNRRGRAYRNPWQIRFFLMLLDKMWEEEKRRKQRNKTT